MITFEDVKQITHRDMFGSWLNSHGLVDVGVEVGVCYGENADKILSTWLGNIHLIDTWGRHDQKVYTEGCDWAKAFEACKLLCVKYPARVNLHRDRSLQIVGELCDEWFNFVYIDGDHGYHSVIADLVAWWPKVARGGVLGLHDATYNEPPTKEVKRALDSWSNFMKLPVHTTPCSSAWIPKLC
jgi:hypothetical protein